MSGIEQSGFDVNLLEQSPSFIQNDFENIQNMVPLVPVSELIMQFKKILLAEQTYHFFIIHLFDEERSKIGLGNFENSILLVNEVYATLEDNNYGDSEELKAIVEAVYKMAYLIDQSLRFKAFDYNSPTPDENTFELDMADLRKNLSRAL